MAMFDGLEDRIMNPMVMGGLGLAFGGMSGLQSGMQSGLMASKFRKDQQQQQMFSDAMQSALDDPRFASLSDGERRMFAANPQMAQGIFGEMYKHQFDPNSELKRRAGEAELNLFPYKQALLKAQANMTNAHAGYYNEAARTRGPQVDINAAQAEARRQELESKFYRDADGNIQRRPIIHEGHRDVRSSLEAVPTSSRIETIGGATEDQASFPEVPRDAGPIRIETTSRAPVTGSAESGSRKVMDQNLTDEDIQAYYDMKFPGTRGKGNLWRRDGTLQKMETTQSERLSHQMAQDALTELKLARKNLSESGYLGQLGAASFDVPYFGTKRPLEGLLPGSEKAGIAMRGVQASINDLLFALSGKQVSDKEREHYSDMYMPRSTDSEKLQTWKLDRMERFFTRVSSARKTGATDEDIAQMIRKEMEYGRASSGQQSSPAPAAIPNQQRRVYDPSTGGFR